LTTNNDETYILHYQVSGDDFTRAGTASSDLKSKLKMMNIDNNVIRRAAIALYEGEINMVIHANGGTITVVISDNTIRMVLKDTGPGIADIDKAMQEGFSTAPEEVRALGFGAGMGLPNMKKFTDNMYIESEPGVGTTVTMEIYFG
jgi:anti-sigma regulatory factor (Ser/Thr protein kinase)